MRVVVFVLHFLLSSPRLVVVSSVFMGGGGRGGDRPSRTMQNGDVVNK